MANTVTETANQILERAIINLRDNTQITRFSPGSKARTILGIMAAEIERLEDILSSNTVLSLVNGASGIYLDFIGELVGVQRQSKTAAQTVSTDRSVRIYAGGSLTFGDFNQDRQFTIPAGTVIRSEDGSIAYATITPTILSPTDTEIFVGIRALKYGSTGNIARGVLSELEFEGYSSFPDLSLSVENISAIESGLDEETDKFYRYRITNALISSETGNITAVRLAVLSIQSVADAVVLTLYRGIGTADIILDTTTGEVSNITIESVRRAISLVDSLGMSIRVRAPSLVGLELALNVRYIKGLGANDKNQINNNIRNIVSELIARTSLGGSIQLNTLASSILSSDKRIVDIGVPNRPLDEVILWRNSALGGRRATPLVQNSNISLLIDERLVLEGSSREAIRITEV